MWPAPTVPSVVTTVPSVVTSVPSVATTVPSVATTVPSVATTVPSVATTGPSVATTVPSVVTTVPFVATTLPSVAPPVPFATTIVPSVVTTVPLATRTVPLVTTTVPFVATTLPSAATVVSSITTAPGSIGDTRGSITIGSALLRAIGLLESPPMSSPLRAAAFVAALLLAAPARAGGVSLAVPAGPGQEALALRVESAGVRARACAAAPCDADGGTLIAPPEGPAPRLDQAKAVSLTLEGGRTVARVDVPGDAPGSDWVLLVAAPLAGNGADPVKVWSGWTGVSHGEEGEEHSAAVVVEALAGGARVLVGERRADVTLCGRPTLVAERAIDPATLALVRGASTQNLSVDERARAAKVTAARAKGDAPASQARVLHATSASSALGGKLGAITDGDLATAWSEGKAGDGRGEFVTMSAPEEVGIGALDVVVRPTEDVAGGVAPRRFYVATPDALFEVTMPEDAFRQPAGTRYTVKLPAEIHASCVAVVLDQAYSSAKDARVTIAEVEAHTAFDGATPEALAGALAGGGDRARAAAAMLVRSGRPGVAAVLAVYDKLDERGQLLADTVVDAAPCSTQAPFFAARLAAAGAAAKPGTALEDDPAFSHARDRIRRCGHASAPALVDLIEKGAPRAKVLAAAELAALAPAESVAPLLDAIASADDATRRDLRAALARAAKSPHAFGALHDELDPAKLAARGEKVSLDLLRAAGPSLGRIEGAPAAFADLSAHATSFRGRFLLQAPAAALAQSGDARAADYLRRSLREDADLHVRARAAAVAGAVPALSADLAAALGDAEPRVREAALNAIADAAGRAGGPPVPAAALRERLARDDWTFVRAGAARTLGAAPADAETDRALAAALSDGSPDVRAQALDALGAHRAVAHLDAVRARQDDDGENVEVRAHAILALAGMCDTQSLSAWTKLALVLRGPGDDRDRRLGSAAIAALGQVHPADLAQRLAPLVDKEVPPAVREAARAALAAHGECEAAPR